MQVYREMLEARGREMTAEEERRAFDRFAELNAPEGGNRKQRRRAAREARRQKRAKVRRG